MANARANGLSLVTLSFMISVAWRIAANQLSPVALKVNYQLLLQRLSPADFIQYYK